MQQHGRWALLIAGVLSVLYSVAVLMFVATSPDLRFRCLLVDESPLDSPVGGVRIHAPDDLELHYRGAKPGDGDLLLSIGNQPTPTFLHFTSQLTRLRTAELPSGGKVHIDTDPSELRDSPWLVEEVETGRRLVQVQFLHRGATEPDTTYLLVQSVPLRDILLTVVWFVLHLGILLVGAFAYWNRPFDRPARLFYVMCLVTLGAFVGGYHWWVIVASLALNVPFIVCATLLPAVTLHFFLSYPRAKPPLSRWPGPTLIGLYAAPALAILGILSLVGYSRWLLAQEASLPSTQPLLQSLEWVREGIYSYFLVAAVYFLATLLALVYSFATTRNPIEHSQVKWILGAGMLAVFPVGYTLYLAYFHRDDFALGSASLPMFLASLCFMLAYAVGIIRYKLMLSDYLIVRGLGYYAVTFALMLLFSTGVAAAGVGQQLLNISLSPAQLAMVFVLLMLSAALLLWMRDRVQQIIDRRFFRGRFQLDKALERVNRAAGRLVEPASLGEVMLGSCRDVLRVERSALYLRNSARGPFELVACEGSNELPLQCTVGDDVCEALREDGCWRRVPSGSHEEHLPVQQLLRGLDAEILHGLEVDGVLVGLMVLGRKANGAAYTSEDLTFVNALRQITNIGLHSAKVHQGMLRLNEELQLKVEKVRSQQRQIEMLQAELALTDVSRGGEGPPRQPTDLRRDAIKGNGPAIRSVLETVRKVAGSQSTVLIRGESGTGKELLAQVLHENSPRAHAPLVAVHCASLSPSLLESELFGHVKGAFTGAHQDKMGRFEAAHGGTLFLDEIGDISLETQVKLLRVLQERSFEPVGGTRSIQVDVRLITATHQNLERLIAEGRFREDLYYRLNVISITLPPLRERTEDLVELALCFLNRATERLGKRIRRFDDRALVALERHSWPGNIRELQNVIERAAVLAEGDRITLDDLPEGIRGRSASAAELLLDSKPLRIPASPQPASNNRHADVPGIAFAPLDSGAGDEAEREALLHALEHSNGNKARAARLLGMPRSTFFSKLKKHSLA